MGNTHSYLKTIRGPISVSHCVGDKEIYLFGDNHDGDKTSCNKAYSIVEVIEMIISCNLNVKIDLFLEIMYLNDFIFEGIGKKINEFPNPDNNYLGQLRNYFKDCVYSKNITCSNKWSNLRFHGIDIRRLLPSKKWYSIENDKTSAERITKQNYTQEEKKKIDEYFTSEKDHFKVKCQVKNITNKNIAILLNRYIFDKFKKETRYLMKLVLIMDHYTLGRMLRNFGNYESKYIIVYAGDKHIQSYKDFFKYVLMYETRSNSSIYRCVDVGKFNLPLFTTNTTSGNMSDKNWEEYKKSKSVYLEIIKNSN